MQKAGPCPPEPLGPAQTGTLATRCSHQKDRGAGSPLSTQTSPDTPPIAYLSPAGHQAGDRWSLTATAGLDQGRTGWLVTYSVAAGRTGALGVWLGARFSGSPPARSGSGGDCARTAGASSPPPRAGLPPPFPSHPPPRCSFLWQPGNAAQRRPPWVDGRGRPLSAPHRGDTGTGAPLVNFRCRHGFAGQTPRPTASLQGM